MSGTDGLPWVIPGDERGTDAWHDRARYDDESPLVRIVYRMLVEDRCSSWSLLQRAMCGWDLDELVKAYDRIMARRGPWFVPGPGQPCIVRPLALTGTRRLTVRVAERDGGWRCRYCGCVLVDLTAATRCTVPDHECPGYDDPSGRRVWWPELDHVIPRSRGGTDSIENRALSCAPCNRKKGATMPSSLVPS